MPFPSSPLPSSPHSAPPHSYHLPLPAARERSGASETFNSVLMSLEESLGAPRRTDLPVYTPSLPLIEVLVILRL